MIGRHQPRPWSLATTGIGSLPHTQLEMALQQSLQLDIPFLPSLPARDPAELMIPQAADGLPGITFDREGNTTIDAATWERDARRFSAELDRALEASAHEAFEPSASSWRAWKPFLFEVENRRLRFAKAQCTGPLTAQWVLKLDDGRAISAIPELERQVYRLVLARALSMVHAIRERGATPLFFFDEPGLYALDKRNPIHLVRLQELRIAILALKKAGAIVGLHCCSNTAWDALLTLGLDVLSLDARLSLSAVLATGAAVDHFIAGGGMLSLGIVPTNVASSYDLTPLVESTLTSMRAHGGEAAVRRMLAQTLLTPACGLGLRSVLDAEQTFVDVKAAQAMLRREAGK